MGLGEGDVAGSWFRRGGGGQAGGRGVGLLSGGVLSAVGVRGWGLFIRWVWERWDVVGNRGVGMLDEAGIGQEGQRVEAGGIGDWDNRCLVGGWMEG